jgi:hypothetical protein
METFFTFAEIGFFLRYMTFLVASRLFASSVDKKTPENPGFFYRYYLCSEKINQWDSTRAPLETQGGIYRKEKLSRRRKQ